MKYESGVAVKQANKSLKLLAPRNPKGTLPADWKCPFFHPKFCTTTGHRDCKSASCHMSGKTKEVRDAASLFIKEEALAIAISTNKAKGKRKYIDINYYSCFLHCTYISYFIQLFYVMNINHINL